MKMDLEDFCENFKEIYSYKEDQQGRKTCKWCRYYTEKMPKEYRDRFSESLPESMVNGFGICKMAGKIAMKSSFEKPFAIAVGNNGVCTLFKVSILKKIKAIFF